jgi:hypothetical protein
MTSQPIRPSPCRSLACPNKGVDELAMYVLFNVSYQETVRREANP